MKCVEGRKHFPAEGRAPVRLLLRRLDARKADGGVRREKRPETPMFSTGAGRF